MQVIAPEPGKSRYTIEREIKAKESAIETLVRVGGGVVGVGSRSVGHCSPPNLLCLLRSIRPSLLVRKLERAIRPHLLRLVYYDTIIRLYGYTIPYPTTPNHTKPHYTTETCKALLPKANEGAIESWLAATSAMPPLPSSRPGAPPRNASPNASRARPCGLSCGCYTYVLPQARRHATRDLLPEELKQCIYSIGDNHAYLYQVVVW